MYQQQAARSGPARAVRVRPGGRGGAAGRRRASDEVIDAEYVDVREVS